MATVFRRECVYAEVKQEMTGNTYKYFQTVILAAILGGILSLLLLGCARVRGSQDEDKQTIVFACIHPDIHIQKQVREFNSSQSEYQIEVKDYGRYKNPQERLDLDIVSGEIPDILDMSSLDFDQYSAKGLLCDLYAYMDADEEIGREDFIDNVLRAMEIDGRLYYMTPFFTVGGLMGRAQDTAEPLTLRRLKEMESRYGEGTKGFGHRSNIGILYMLTEADYKHFIDWETGVCHFDTEEFRELLEYACSYPDRQIVMQDTTEVAQEMREHKVLFKDLAGTPDLSNLFFYRDIFDAEVGFIGYPSRDGKGASAGRAYLSYAIGITVTSKQKEGAWEFLKTLMSEEYSVRQMEEYPTDGYPLRRDAFEAMVRKYTATQAYTDAYGHAISPVNGSIGLEGIESETIPLTEEDIAYLRGIIVAIDHAEGNFAPAVLAILTEEAQSYFDGRQEIDKTIENIQSRVSVYVSEHQ